MPPAKATPGSEVPPCCTITFDGGQFGGAVDVPVLGAFPGAAALEEGEPGASGPEAAGAPLQFDAIAFGLRRLPFVVVPVGFWREEVVAGVGADCEGGVLAGVWAGEAAPCGSVPTELAD